jgi:hypothetical protein
VNERQPPLTAIILAEQDTKVAHEFAQEALARRAGGPNDLYSIPYLRLFGSKSEAEDAAQDLRQRKPPWPWCGGWYGQVLDFECGGINAEQLLKRAGTSQQNLAEANFDIGITCLADGRQEEAKKYFQAVIDTGLPGSVLYTDSDLILARMEQNPAWPHWIPASATQPAMP